jgi:4-coumarate--CoA ligase
LLDHWAVADVCVVGVPDSYSGEIPKAFVVLHEKAAQMIEEDKREEEIIKESICKVGTKDCCRSWY